MRFISKYGRFGIVVRPMIQEAYATGMAKVVQEPVYAMFEPWTLTPEERELALSRWTFNGFYQLEDEVSIMPPDYRIGVFDSVIDQETKGYSDETRLEVERVLVANAAITDNIIVVPATMIAPPWPRYDEYTGTPAALLRKLVDEGYELDEVLEYERASQDRPKIVAALEAAIDDPDSELEPEPQKEEVLG